MYITDNGFKRVVQKSQATRFEAGRSDPAA